MYTTHKHVSVCVCGCGKRTDGPIVGRVKVLEQGLDGPTRHNVLVLEDVNGNVMGILGGARRQRSREKVVRGAGLGVAKVEGAVACVARCALHKQAKLIVVDTLRGEGGECSAYTAA